MQRALIIHPGVCVGVEDKSLVVLVVCRYDVIIDVVCFNVEGLFRLHVSTRVALGDVKDRAICPPPRFSLVRSRKFNPIGDALQGGRHLDDDVSVFGVVEIGINAIPVVARQPHRQVSDVAEGCLLLRWCYPLRAEVHPKWIAFGHLQYLSHILCINLQSNSSQPLLPSRPPSALPWPLREG